MLLSRYRICQVTQNVNVKFQVKSPSK